MTVAIGRFDFVNVNVSDIDRSLEFYRSLGFTIHTLAAQSIKILEGQNKILALLQGQAKHG